MTLQEHIQDALCNGQASANELLSLILQLQLSSMGFTPDGNTAFVYKGVAFSVPPFDEQEFTYYDGTNNIETQVFKKSGAVVSTLTYTYVNAAANDDDLVQSIQQS